MKKIKLTLIKIKNFFKSIKYKSIFQTLFQLALIIMLLTNIIGIMYDSTIYFDLAKYSIATFWLLVIGYVASKR